ncbi:hypothetical protein UY3_09922 [Chelonia mydas]|uniref:Uncharacterized protein n=1 Tax=Chelonia mydas TaxID=8469 RepID=M7BLN4_CHEMY|nr:hypothetical protein UY3_09922 [Chelonia mydas]
MGPARQGLSLHKRQNKTGNKSGNKSQGWRCGAKNNSTYFQAQAWAPRASLLTRLQSSGSIHAAVFSTIVYIIRTHNGHFLGLYRRAAGPGKGSSYDKVTLEGFRLLADAGPAHVIPIA